MTRATRIHTIFATSGKLNIAMKQMIFTNAAHPELHYTARDYTKPVNSFPLTNNISSRVAIHKVMRLLLVTLRHQAHVIVHSAAFVFEAIGLRVVTVAGRYFNGRYQARGPPVSIVSQNSYAFVMFTLYFRVKFL